jgi:hypothetical protein
MSLPMTDQAPGLSPGTRPGGRGRFTKVAGSQATGPGPAFRRLSLSPGPTGPPHGPGPGPAPCGRPRRPAGAGRVCQPDSEWRLRRPGRGRRSGARARAAPRPPPSQLHSGQCAAGLGGVARSRCVARARTSESSGPSATEPAVMHGRVQDHKSSESWPPTLTDNGWQEWL